VVGQAFGDPEVHTHLGILDCASLVGMDFGIRVNTTMNDELVILKPTSRDIVMKFSRKDPGHLPKDIGMIIIRCGITQGAGSSRRTGSGAATAALAYMWPPKGTSTATTSTKSSKRGRRGTGEVRAFRRM